MKIKLRRNRSFPKVVWMAASFGPVGYRVPQVWARIVGPLELDIYFPEWLVLRTLRVPEPCDCGEHSDPGCSCDEAAAKWAACAKNSNV